MALFGDDERAVAVNLSLPERAVERAHCRALYSDNRRAFEGGMPDISVSVQYDGDELTEDDVDLTEDWLAFVLYDAVGSRYFD